MNFADPFGLFACPPDCGFEGDPRNLEREVEMVRSRTPRDVAFAVGAVGVATVGAFGVMAATSSAMALTMVATRLAPAGVAMGKGTEKLIDVLQEAGPGMDQRILAVSRWLPAGQRALMSSLEGGARMLSGGAGERARQIILNPNGETIIKALNVTSKTYEVIATIKPK